MVWYIFLCALVYSLITGWLVSLLPPYYCKKCGAQQIITGYDDGMSPFDGVHDPIYECPKGCD